MVRIISFREKEREDGTLFCLLELQGGVEMVKSQQTGNFYATAKKAWIPSTFDATTCEALIGSEMQGSIVKQEVEPYTYVVKETGEELILTHRWVYTPKEKGTSTEPRKENETNPEVFSANGIGELEPEMAL